MVRMFSSTHTYQHSWEDVSYAFLRKYPNPLSSHVLGCDVVNRSIDETGVLHSVRLINKKAKDKPRIAEYFTKGSNGWLLEESTIDPNKKVMVTITRNLTLRSILKVEERCTYSVSAENNQWTECKTEAHFSSPIWGWSHTVEGVSLEKFKGSMGKAREALEYVIDTVVKRERHRHHLPALKATAASP
eukprot:comp21472_c0_seq1/m.29724 comp21472_c0_seq1/g.29724  ORF comp21472_c0_seq1/g.29724 comp21472_c0_seq1/m.29724 type:complete len:188 (-) comp21472_c0_seq1:547-1110(-)